MEKWILVLGILGLLMFSNSINAQNAWMTQTNPLGMGDTAIIGKVEFVSPTEGWISGGRGDFLHTTDAGVNWMVVTPFPNDTVWCSSDPAVSMSWVNATHGWKINSFGPEFGNAHGVVIHKTTDSGNTWQKKVLSTTEGDFGFKIQFVDINNGWLLYFNFTTQVATFLKTTDGGNNWVPFNGAGIFYFVDVNNGWSYYGSGVNGAEPPFKILRTTNGGTDWIEQFSDNAAGGYNAMHFTDLNNGWIVGDNGKVIKTTNGGNDWNYVINSGINQNDRSKAVFFLDANSGWISSKDILQNPYIQHTTDGGLSWQTQATPLGNPNGHNAIFSIYFVDAQNGWLTADDGNICRYTGTTEINVDKNYINRFEILQNYPNPFNPSTSIKYAIGNRQFVQLKVYDVLGNEVAKLVDGYKPAGSYEVEFQSTVGSRELASGVYYYQLRTGSFTQTKKMILIK